MALGLGTGLGKGGIIGSIPGVVTSNLVMKHMYPAGAVQPLSDGAADLNADAAANEYIDVGTIAISTGDISISFWVYVTAFGTSNAGYFCNRESGGTNLGVEIRNDGTDSKIEIVLDYGGAVFQPTTSTLNTHQWYHICGTVDRDGYMYLYVDGVQDGSSDISAQSSVNLNHSSVAKIGQNKAANEMSGYLCNAGYWNRVLTQAEVKSIMWKQYADLTTTETTNLVSWWNLDTETNTSGESGTGGVKDHHGSNHGTLS